VVEEARPFPVLGFINQLSPDSNATRLRNGVVEGYGNARDSVLALVLFVEEYLAATAV
jgi:hypothetical protein